MISDHEYQTALDLHRDDVPFYALIAAAMLKADTFNTARLMSAWPEIYRAVDARYDGISSSSDTASGGSRR
jgi:hypothetical protein